MTVEARLAKLEDTARVNQQEIHFLREEVSGLRETVEGMSTSQTGLLKAYAATSQRSDLLSRQLEVIEHAAANGG